jgi:hypothetical protein
LARSAQDGRAQCPSQIRKQLDTVVSPKSKLTKPIKKPKAAWVEPSFFHQKLRDPDSAMKEVDRQGRPLELCHKISGTAVVGSTGTRVTDRPLCADSVEKVENRGALKISRMSIFGLLRRYVALAPLRSSMIDFG